jgi:hypothetical protein
VALAVATVAFIQQTTPAPAPGPPSVLWSVGGADVLARTSSGTSVFGFMPVVPMVIVSALLMFVVSKLTAKPSAATVAKYFSK